ncbi:MAG: hypothetical protein M0Z68_09370 [Gammaproteobacteria bacterium]|nr:hypothetical protein [Gammaproteobacteria bacterium]
MIKKQPAKAPKTTSILFRFIIVSFGVFVGVIFLMASGILIANLFGWHRHKRQHAVTPNYALTYAVNNFSKENFCEMEAAVLTKNISMFCTGVNLEMTSPYDRFYSKAQNVLKRFEWHSYSGYSKPGKAWRSIEAKADSGILKFTRGALERFKNGSVNELVFNVMLERTNLILSMDKHYCGSPSWWPKQYSTSSDGMKKLFQKGD